MTPGFAGMLGGEMLEVSGPCLEPRDRIFLRFGTESAYSQCIMVNSMKARCPVPMLLERGEVKVSMSFDEKANFHYDANMLIGTLKLAVTSACSFVIIYNHCMLHNYVLITVHPSRMPGSTKVKLHDNGPGRRWNETTASVLTLSWNPDLLSTDPQAQVDINFVGFIENTKTYQVQITSNFCSKQKNKR